MARFKPSTRMAILGIALLFAIGSLFNLIRPLTANAQIGQVDLAVGWQPNGSGHVEANLVTGPISGATYTLEVCDNDPIAVGSVCTNIGPQFQSDFTVPTAKPSDWVRVKVTPPGALPAFYSRSIQFGAPQLPDLIFERNEPAVTKVYLELPSSSTPMALYVLNGLPMPTTLILKDALPGTPVEVLVNYLDNKFEDKTLVGYVPQPMVSVWSMSPSIKGEAPTLTLTSSQAGTNISTHWVGHNFEVESAVELDSRQVFTDNAPASSAVVVTQRWKSSDGTVSNYRLRTSLDVLPNDIPVVCRTNSASQPFVCTAQPGAGMPAGTDVFYDWTGSTSMPESVSDDGLTAQFRAKAAGEFHARVTLWLDNEPFAGGFADLIVVDTAVVQQLPVTVIQDLAARTSRFEMNFSSQPIAVLAACAPQGTLEVETSSLDGTVSVEEFPNFSIALTDQTAEKLITNQQPGITRVTFRLWSMCGSQNQRTLTHMGTATSYLGDFVMPLISR